MMSVGSARSGHWFSNNRSPHWVSWTGDTLPHAPAVPVALSPLYRGMTCEASEPTSTACHKCAAGRAGLGESRRNRHGSDSTSPRSRIGNPFESERLQIQRPSFPRSRKIRPPAECHRKRCRSGCRWRRWSRDDGASNAGFRTRSRRPMRARCPTLQSQDPHTSPGGGRSPRSHLRWVPSAHGGVRERPGAAPLWFCKSRFQYRLRA